MIDLRSDTLTKPCIKMLDAIWNASFNDSSYGEDESTNQLEEYCANYFGKESALFMPSGTMSNQVAIRCWTQPGDEIILHETYHINYFEVGPTVDLGKVNLNLCQNGDGIIRSEDISNALENKHRSNISSYPTLICLENSINTLGGKIYPLREVKNTYEYAKKYNLHIHLDGARLLNSCLAENVLPRDYAQYVDSLTICFSKGLGAPFGSILLGSHNFIKKAQKYRKWYGGGLHQSGLMAAAALYAIQNNITRLADDHKNAQLLALLLNDNPIISINNETVETNIVMININNKLIESKNLVNSLKKEKEVLLYPWNRYQLRAVTHLGLNEENIKDAAERINCFCKSIY